MKVDIKKYIKIKDSKVENRNFTIPELGNILKEMYSNAENKMQVASIHIFGIKYGKNIIQKAFQYNHSSTSLYVSRSPESLRCVTTF